VRTFRGVGALIFTALIGVVPAALVAQAAAAGGAQTNHWSEAKCDIKPGHYLVNSGLLYLKSATETRFPEQKQKDLRDAQRVLNQALTSGNQDKNPAAWYYLGRYYILANDAVGADSAFARAQALKPECKTDIDLWRRYVWAPTFNAGVAAWQANNTDSAISSFKRASALLPQDPTAPKYIATLYYNSGQADSAMVYFRRAADVAAKDPKLAQDRKDALYNLGRIQQSQQKLAEAEATYREYLALYPNDPDILAPLGSLLMQRGAKDSAFAIYKQIIARGDSMGYIALLRAGVEISQSVPEEPDTAAAGTSCRAASKPAATGGGGGGTGAAAARSRAAALAKIRARCDSVNKATMKQHVDNSREAYTLAAQALDASLKLNPYYRETLIYRTNVALGQRDSALALSLARRLIAVDPMNRTSLRMMAFAQQTNGHIDSTLHYLRLGDSTLVGDVAITQFDSTDTGRELKGNVKNPRTSANAPFKLIFEFVNLKGNVVATETVNVPAIQPGQSFDFDVKPAGASIAAWRYHKE
jgi:tetratricopeptide (TPR) repeat protein